jgi:hypothetical protein
MSAEHPLLPFEHLTALVLQLVVEQLLLMLLL